MDTKKAAPMTDAANQNQQNNTNNIHIACPYERRLLARLVKGKCARKVLDDVIGTTNAPEYVSRLRGRGLAIHTDWVTGFNRDKRRIRWGVYYLPSHELDRVRKSLGAHHGKAQG